MGQDVDPELFAQLRELRLEMARKEKVPPYIIFSDKTLAQMCTLRPRTRAQMLEVSGVGEFKYEKYGEQFLQKIRELSADGTIPEKPEPPEETSVGEAEENISGQEKKSGKRAVKQSLS